MPVICIIMRVPGTSLAKMNEIYQENIQKFGLPSEKYGKIVNTCYFPDGDKIKIVQLIEVDSTNEGAFMDASILFNVRYYAEVPGFEVQRHVGYNIEEATTIGEKTA